MMELFFSLGVIGFILLIVFIYLGNKAEKEREEREKKWMVIRSSITKAAEDRDSADQFDTADLGWPDDSKL